MLQPEFGQRENEKMHKLRRPTSPPSGMKPLHHHRQIPPALAGEAQEVLPYAPIGMQTIDYRLQAAGNVIGLVWAGNAWHF